MITALSCILLVLLTPILLVPPIREWFFSNKMWPFATPWDITKAEVAELKHTARPGDVIVEKNIHSWHWMLLCKAATRSSWVHAAIVDEDRTLISMFKEVKRQGFSTYLEKQSTDVILLRPPYRDSSQVKLALQYARSRISTPFDPDFNNDAGNCTGLIATTLKAGGVHVPKRRAFIVGKYIYGAVDFFNIQGVRVIWRNKHHRAKVSGPQSSVVS
jgi:hypothetical protein